MEEQLTSSIAETRVLELLDQGFPAKNLLLQHLSAETLLKRVRQGNVAWYAMREAGEVHAAQNMEENVDMFLDELGNRYNQVSQQSRMGRSVSGLLKRKRQKNE